MINETEAIKKHLGIQIGIRIDDGEFDHYALLGLEPNADPLEIKQALRTAVAVWNNSDTKSDPESAQWVAKRIKQAQAVLLDEQKKKSFDESLLARASSVENAYFPDGDPYAPFNPTECLVGANSSHSVLDRENFVDFGNAHDRWSELSRRIPTLLHALPQAVAHSTPQSVVADPPEIVKRERSDSTAYKIEQLRRKRKLSQGFYLAGFLTVAAAFLAYAGIRFVMNRQQIAQRLDEDAKDSVMKIASSKLTESAPKTIGGNLAPNGAANGSRMVLPTLSKDETSEESKREFTANNPFGNPLDNMSLASGPMPTTSPAPAAMQPTASTPVAIPQSPAAATQMPASMQPTADSKAAWVIAMKSGREALDKGDFKTFHRQMEVSFPLSSGEEMTAKQARLDQLGQLYEIFIKAVREAKSKMRGAETLSIGKALVSIVEIKEEELIVRIQGNSVHYPWDRLPPGIATAMADFTLSEQEPIDVAARAVYFSLSPARNELFSKKVQDWFEKSIGKGSVRKDLVQALTDTYE